MRILLALLFSAFLAAPFAEARMFKGEEMLNPDGYPALVHFQKGSRGRPLIVLVAGSGNTGRIFYGVHKDRRPEDFLATHLVAMGYNTLTVTLPMDTQDPIFKNAYPDFDVTSWGKMLAKAAGTFVARHDLSHKVMLAGWSMGGKAAQSMKRFSQAEGIELELFISLAATPPLHGVLDMELTAPINSETGYGAAPDPEYKGLLWNIGVNARKNGVAAIIPKESLLQHYVGEGPVGLTHTGLRYKDGKIVHNAQADLDDAQGNNFAGYPLIGTVVPLGRHDLRHTTTDEYTWGMITTNNLYRTQVLPNLDALHQIPREAITAMADMIRTAPSRLSVDVPGNHFFFVGEFGARKTAEAIAWIEAEASALRDDLGAIVQDTGQNATASLE